jgi:hypothetical protein
MQQAKILVTCLALATAIKLEKTIMQSTSSVTKIDATGKPFTVTEHTVGETLDPVRPTPLPIVKLAQTESLKRRKREEESKPTTEEKQVEPVNEPAATETITPTDAVKD